MARGAWVRELTAAIKAAGGDIPIDPYGLFDEAGGEAPRMPYNPAVLQAIQDSGKFG